MALTPHSQETHDRRMLRRLGVWVSYAKTMIDDIFDDARSHLDRACSEAAKNTADGRPTAIKARASRSTQAAEKKLRLLLTALAGPSINSLEGFIQDAREDFYVDSFGFWHRAHDAGYVTPADRPTHANIRAIRGALWHGLPLRSALGSVIESTITASQAAVAQACLSGISWKTSAQILDNWSDQRSRGLFVRVKQCLSDQDKLADTQAMEDAIAPKYRPTPGSPIPGA